ncbi:trimethylamine dehydrogenase [mine drainage metagenome]|uniref:Trimethylamine dehydrogenase n=1 Tax=mine drainage metagenome TaxID=410659 RepID=A0A1J5PH12_9ZZZZ
MIQRRLLELGVTLHLNRAVGAVLAGGVEVECTYTGRLGVLDCDAVVMVTSRVGQDGLYQDLRAREAEWAEAGLRSVRVIGDAEAPAPIAWATYAGRRYAEEMDSADIGDALPFRRQVVGVAD